MNLTTSAIRNAIKNNTLDMRTIEKRLIAIAETIGGPVAPLPAACKGEDKVGPAEIAHKGDIGELVGELKQQASLVKLIRSRVYEVFSQTGAASCDDGPYPDTDFHESINLSQMVFDFGNLNIQFRSQVLSELNGCLITLNHVNDFITGEPRAKSLVDTKPSEVIGAFNLLSATAEDIRLESERIESLLGQLEGIFDVDTGEGVHHHQLPNSLEIAKAGGVKAFVDGERRDDLRS